MATTQKIKSTLNSWATLETPPSMFQRYLPEKLKPQLGHVFPFAYPRIGERVNSAFLRALGAEFLGTMLFMFILVSQVVFSCRGASCSLPDEEGYMATAATAGFTMFALIYATASFSGGKRFCLRRDGEKQGRLTTDFDREKRKVTKNKTEKQKTKQT